MEDPLEIMKAALRVLTAIQECTYPNTHDVEILRTCCDPAMVNKSPDEIACDVIQRALRVRAALRKSADAAGLVCL